MTNFRRTHAARRPLAIRCSALVWAVAFLLAGLRPAYAEAGCRHHEHAGQETAAHGEAHAHHGHAAHHASPSPSDAPEPAPPPHPDFCTCIGPCQAAGAAAMPGPAPAAPLVPLAAAERDASVRAVVALPGRASYLLPYATAPPRDR